MNSVVTQRFIKSLNQLKEDNRIRSGRQFAMSLDYLPQSLSEILKGRRDVTIELLRKAVEKYRLNPIYLYTGEGAMYMAEDENEGLRVLTIVTDGDDDERIVHVPMPAQAGYADQMSDPTFVQELPTFTLPDYKYKVGTHRSFDISGDSMEPTLFEGDKVICSYIEPDLWASSIKDSHVYVVVTRGDVLVKRVENNINKDKELLLVSDNDYYKPYTMPAEEVREVWYVRAKLSPFLPAPNNSKDTFKQDMEQMRKTIANQNTMIDNLNKTIEKLLAKPE